MMIRSFKDKRTRDVFDGLNSKEARQIDRRLHGMVRRKLDYINGARNLQDLAVPPGNKLEALYGDLLSFHSIRINDQWRIIFRWSASGADDVAIIDYH